MGAWKPFVHTTSNTGVTSKATLLTLQPPSLPRKQPATIPSFSTWGGLTCITPRGPTLISSAGPPLARTGTC